MEKQKTNYYKYKKYELMRLCVKRCIDIPDNSDRISKIELICRLEAYDRARAEKR